MGLLGFHLGAPDAPGETETDVAAFGGRFADGGVVGVEAAAAGADGAEDIGLGFRFTIIQPSAIS